MNLLKSLYMFLELNRIVYLLAFGKGNDLKMAI